MKWRYAVVGVVGLGFGAALTLLLAAFFQGQGSNRLLPDTTAVQNVSEYTGDMLPAEEAQPSDDVVVASLAPVPYEPPGGSSQAEGVKVHGHWTIDILEQDGTLVSHREFENALLGTGGRRIAEIVARRMLPRYWGIRLRHNTLSNSPCLNGSSATSCVIYEPQGIDASFTSNNLVVTPNSDGTLILSGSKTAQRNGQITSVTTLHNGRPCAEGVSYPGDCAGSSGTEVTRTSISPAIDVVNGQVISATVRISFE